VVFGAVTGSQPELRDVAALFDPFALSTVGEATRYWTASDANTRLPELAGLLLWNRLIWIAVGLAAVALAYALFSFTGRGVSKRKLRRLEKRRAKLARTAPVLATTLPATNPRRAAMAQLWARTKFEMVQVFRSPAFAVLLIIGLFNAGGAIWYANETFGTPALPLTFALIQPLVGSFAIIPIIIAIYYAGELVWRDRERGMHEIVDATPLPNWAYMVPKTLAVAGVLFATLLIGVISAMLIQMARGWMDVEPLKWISWFVLPQAASMLLIAILAVFVQALSPNKYVGWAIMVVYLVASITLATIGLNHPLYDYGSNIFPAISDMNGDRTYAPLSWWLNLYRGGVALVLAVLAHLLWRRGNETRLGPRLRRMPARLKGVPGLLIAGGLAVTLATGFFLFNNINVVNDYRTSDDRDRMAADYEKTYLKYESVPQPSITDVTLKVDLYPEETRAEIEGGYAWVNDTGAPLEVLHVRLLDQDTRIVAIDVPGATLEMDDEDNKYRIYRFATPIAPGATGRLLFRTQRWQQGLRAGGNDTRLVRNGTFLNNSEIAPLIGMDRSGLLSDRAKRRKYGLPPELRMPTLEDESARRKNYIGDWVNADITVSTSAGQTPIAPGSRMSDEVRNGRRTARFAATSPILNFFSIQSANYAVTSREDAGVRLSVYSHPRHDYNIDGMLDAMSASLDYFRANFGPYQFDYARIIEFPTYAQFAQAFAGTIPYSEGLGFIADTSDPDEIDYVYYVTAHELGHQYWGHQLIAAEMQGGTMLIETMAQYSALMVMKARYGEDKMRRFLKYELDRYLSARGSEAIEELPLNRVEDQGYIHYRKGSVAMYLLQHRLGESRVNAMLADLIARYRFKGAPYATSTDLVAGFRGLARNGEERQLVEDLLTRITIYDFKVASADTKRRADGKWETTITAEMGKRYADGKGVETDAPLMATLPVGLFAARPGYGAFSVDDVLIIEDRKFTSGDSDLTLVTEEKPAFAGIDAYNFYVDRNSDDNVMAVTQE
ncbi:MAG: M1 family aminopeptidase, partial [Pacificimonas sp.]